ncbi:MAG: preprotein translocase subunit SecA [Nitrospirae bacterium]|nr:preprotein translocase subunit SecA [Candidatus Manganitrophaceae bacterium]
MLGLGTLVRKVVGSRNDRELKRLGPITSQVNALEASISVLSDQELKAKTASFREKLGIPETGPLPEIDLKKLAEALDAILPEAFAVVREASKRVLGMRHFDVQILGGAVLHEGKIAEMKTGEGKTLVATLPVYLNALTRRGVHVITVNDYLAERDSQWMGQLYRFLGLTVGIIQHDEPDVDRQAAYAADITYGTNNEYGFDYLRDNMKFDSKNFVQRDPHYAIIDEVDSILIDEARTPLIISGPAEDSTDLYTRIDKIIPSLKKEIDYTVEEKTKTVTLSEEGNAKAEQLLGVDNLYDLKNLSLVHHVMQGLKAHVLFKRDVDYVVRDGEVIIVDEFTGRMMPGRRWSDGLHQATEAKEGVKIANENQTLASVTFQNYFRLYEKLGGMTGTADTEAAEFQKIYKLEVIVLPTNRDMKRANDPDVIYRTEKEKFQAIVDEVAVLHEAGRPVLVGTISIEKSEHLGALLKRKGVPHFVLNAKYHEREAEIISQAGRKGAVTIATNMAGRGTDILLGGNPDFLLKLYERQHPNATSEALEEAHKNLITETEAEKKEVLDAGGLHIIGTERHESRRVDNQLRGRAARQGDPGSSRFYLSLEDDLLRIFGSDKISNLMSRLGMEEGVPIEHGMVTKAIENAQKRVEGHNFDIRKQLLEYDDVMNKQRMVIYNRRREILSKDEISEDIADMLDEQVDDLLSIHCPEDAYPETWDAAGLSEGLSHQFALKSKAEDFDFSNTGREALRQQVLEAVKQRYEEKRSTIGEHLFQSIEKQLFLRMIDVHWKDHLLGMDSLKEGIGLRGYGQKEPLSEYKKEGFDMFSMMIDRIKGDTIEQLFHVQIVNEEEKEEEIASVFQKTQAMQMNRGESAAPQKTIQRQEKKIGRNDPCSCGSGKKYKKCHGR